MKKSSFLLYILLLLFPIGQFGRLLNLDEITVHLNDLVISMTTATLLIVKILKGEKFKPLSLLKPITFFVFFAFLSLILNASKFSQREIVIASLYFGRWVFYAGIYFFMMNEKLDEKNVVAGLISISLIIAIVGIFQYFLFPDLRFLEKEGWDPHYYRLTAPFFDPTFTGAILTLGLILLVSYSFTKKVKIKPLFVGLLIYIAIALTYSRTSYLMYLIAMGTISFVKRSPKFFLTVLIVGTITLVLLPKTKGYGTDLQRGETIEARLKNWQNSLTIWKDYPLFGVGFNTYRYTQEKYGFAQKDVLEKSHAGAGADSSLLFVAATTGVFGLTSYLALFIMILKKAYLQIQSQVSLALFVSLVSLLIHSWFANSLFYPWIMEWMWILAALEEKRSITKR